MSDFPKWMLALAGVSLLPLLACPLYIWAAQPFGTSESHFVRFLLSLLTQLLWIVPAALFFLSLELYRRGWERWGVAVAVAGALVSAGGAWLAFFS